MAGAVASVVIAFAIIPRLGFTWMPGFDGGGFGVSYRTPPGSSLTYTLNHARELDRHIRSLPEVSFTSLAVGGMGRSGPTGGKINIILKPKGERTRTQFEIQTTLRRELPRFPGLSASIGQTPTIFGGGGAH